MVSRALIIQNTYKQSRTNQPCSVWKRLLFSKWFVHQYLLGTSWGTSDTGWYHSEELVNKSDGSRSVFLTICSVLVNKSEGSRSVFLTICSVIWVLNYQKAHSSGLFFWRFCPLGNSSKLTKISLSCDLLLLLISKKSIKCLASFWILTWRIDDNPHFKTPIYLGYFSGNKLTGVPEVHQHGNVNVFYQLECHSISEYRVPQYQQTLHLKLPPKK